LAGSDDAWCGWRGWLDWRGWLCWLNWRGWLCWLGRRMARLARLARLAWLAWLAWLARLAWLAWLARWLAAGGQTLERPRGNRYEQLVHRSTAAARLW
jgi:hypothetical protein